MHLRNDTSRKRFSGCARLVVTIIGLGLVTLELLKLQIGPVSFGPVHLGSTTLGPVTIVVAGGACFISISTDGGNQCNITSGKGPLSTSSPTTVITTVTPTTATVTYKTQETLTVPFTDVTCPGSKKSLSPFAKTRYSYKGKVTITVTGTGQAKGSQWSDAFYIYTDPKEKALPTPEHVDLNNGYVDAVLMINNQEIKQPLLTGPVPGYNPNHSYTFTIDAPGGQLTFSINDCNSTNNYGSYDVTVSSGA
jgi:hypothetical protein